MTPLETMAYAHCRSRSSAYSDRTIGACEPDGDCACIEHMRAALIALVEAGYAIVLDADDEEREWRPISEADKTQPILAYIPGEFVPSKKPAVLRWFKYNGLQAWRDWDGDAHSPDVYFPLPLPPKEGDGNA